MKVCREHVSSISTDKRCRKMKERPFTLPSLPEEKKHGEGRREGHGMKRAASALIILAAVGGCTSMEHGPTAGGICGGCGSWTSGPARVPGVQGPWGQPVAMAAPYSAAPPG